MLKLAVYKHRADFTEQARRNRQASGFEERTCMLPRSMVCEAQLILPAKA
jgi:hypothetical protein